MAEGITDLFGHIASERRALRSKDLIVPGPTATGQTTLPWNGDPDTIRIESPDRPRTAEELYAALKTLRSETAAYLSDQAPVLSTPRRRVALDRFDWRVQTPADRQGNGEVAEGDWQSVTIPHYGEPIGKAASYYRCNFAVPGERTADERVILHFDGVDYKAHVFVNGHFVGSHEGFFAPFEFDVTDVLSSGDNLLLVRVENDYIFMGNDDPPGPDGTPGKTYQGDKLYAATGLGYDDPNHGWHHCPPGMGICQPVYLETRLSMYISDLFVRPLPEEEQIEIWTEVINSGLESRAVVIDYSIYGQNFEATVTEHRRYHPAVEESHGTGDGLEGPPKSNELLMGPGVNYIRFRADIPQPRLWSPREPWLYQLQARLEDATGNLLDAQSAQFGMRSFLIDEASKPKGALFLNGMPIRLRGSNTMGNFQQDVFTGNIAQLVDDLLLAKLCNINFLRITQRPVQPLIYEYCDRLGVMTQTDLPLFGVLRRNQANEALRQVGEMERLVRNHPCNIQISYINEAFANGRNQPHRHFQRHELDGWMRAADEIVHLQNPDRMIKPHDGDYDPPGPGLPDHHCYTGWYNGHGLGIGKLHRGYWQYVKKGWYYACGEFGAEGLDPVELMRRRYPSEWLPQTGEAESSWNPNAIIKSQTGRYYGMWFDRPSSLAGWVSSSQRHQAFVTRLMAEAFRRDSRMVSNAIHLFIDAFPSGWMKAIMDVERRPKPAYFAYRDACAPVMVSLRTDRFAVTEGETIKVEAWLCNDLPEPLREARLNYAVRSGGRRVLAGSVDAEVEACSSRCCGLIQLDAPSVQKRGRIDVDLCLVSASGEVIDDSHVEVDVLGKPKEVRRPVALLGDTPADAGTVAFQLLQDLEIVPINEKSADTWIIANYETYERQRNVIDAAAESGKTVLFIGLPPGTYNLAGDEVEILPTGMGEFFFVSRATGHPLVEGFERNDFSFWYDPQEDYITPILASVVVSSWETVLASAVVSWGGEGGPAAAVVQRKIGAGCMRICQLKLAGRTVNPVAREFAARLLGAVM